MVEKRQDSSDDGVSDGEVPSDVFHPAEKWNLWPEIDPPSLRLAKRQDDGSDGSDVNVAEDSWSLLNWWRRSLRV